MGTLYPIGCTNERCDMIAATGSVWWLVGAGTLLLVGMIILAECVYWVDQR